MWKRESRSVSGFRKIKSPKWNCSWTTGGDLKSWHIPQLKDQVLLRPLSRLLLCRSTTAKSFPCYSNKHHHPQNHPADPSGKIMFKFRENLYCILEITLESIFSVMILMPVECTVSFGERRRVYFQTQILKLVLIPDCEMTMEEICWDINLVYFSCFLLNYLPVHKKWSNHQGSTKKLTFIFILVLSCTEIIILLFSFEYFICEHRHCYCHLPDDQMNFKWKWVIGGRTFSATLIMRRRKFSLGLETL